MPDVDDIESFVAARRLQVGRQRHRHAADAAADVEDPVVRFQPAVTDEDVEEMTPDFLEVARADEVQWPAAGPAACRT